MANNSGSSKLYTKDLQVGQVLYRKTFASRGSSEVIGVSPYTIFKILKTTLVLVPGRINLACYDHEPTREIRLRVSSQGYVDGFMKGGNSLWNEWWCLYTEDDPEMVELRQISRETNAQRAAKNACRKVWEASSSSALAFLPEAIKALTDYQAVLTKRT